MYHNPHAKASMIWTKELSQAFEDEFEQSLSNCFMFISAMISSMLSSKAWSASAHEPDNIEIATKVAEFKDFSIRFQTESFPAKKYDMLYCYIAPILSWRQLVASKHNITLGFSDPFFQFYTYTHPYFYLFNQEFREVDHEILASNICGVINLMERRYKATLRYLNVFEIIFALDKLIDPNNKLILSRHLTNSLGDFSASCWHEIFEEKSTPTLKFMTQVHQFSPKKRSNRNKR